MYDYIHLLVYRGLLELNWEQGLAGSKAHQAMNREKEQIWGTISGAPDKKGNAPCELGRVHFDQVTLAELIKFKSIVEP